MSFKGICVIQNLVLSDFNLFRLMKKHLSGQYLKIDLEILEVNLILHQRLEADLLYFGFCATRYRWEKCLEHYDGYVENLRIALNY